MAGEAHGSFAGVAQPLAEGVLLGFACRDFQLLEMAVDHCPELFLQLLFLGEGHIAYLHPSTLEVFYGVDVLFFVVAELEGFEFFNDGALLLQVVFLGAVHLVVVGGLPLEELVAGSAEAFPYLVAHLPAHRSYALPLFLQLEQLVGGFLPVFPQGYSLGFQAQVYLPVIVVGLLVPQLSEMFLLLGVVGVEDAFELAPGLFVHVARHRPYGLPHLQQLVEGVGCLGPLGYRVGRRGGQLFGFRYQGLLGQQVVLVFFFSLFEIFALPLFHLVHGVAEPLPYLFVLLHRHWPYLFPLGSQLLRHFGGFLHRGLHYQLFGLFAQQYLLLEVPFHVEVSQLAVDFHLPEQLLQQEVVLLPQVVHLLVRHFSYLVPAVLQHLELVVHLLQAFLVGVYQLPQLLEDLLFRLQVLLLGGLHRVMVLLAFAAVGVVYLVVGLAHGVVALLVVFFLASLFEEFGESCRLHLFLQRGKPCAYLGHSVLYVRNLVGEQRLEGAHQLFPSHRRIVGVGLHKRCVLLLRLLFFAFLFGRTALFGWRGFCCSGLGGLLLGFLRRGGLLHWGVLYDRCLLLFGGVVLVIGGQVLFH